MIKVRVKLNEKKFFIPVPYSVLNLFGFIITSKRINGFINKAIEKDGSKFMIPQIERKDLKPLLHGLSNHKGLVLVDTKLKDGIEVEVKL